MEKRRVFFIFIILIAFCASSLFAEEQTVGAAVAEEQTVEAKIVEDQSVGALFAGEETAKEEVVEKEVKKEESKFEKFLEKAMEIIFPWPILSLETGYPELFSIDIGLETFFIPIADYARTGPYVAYGYARSIHDNFNRFSAGLALGMMGLFDIHGGVGIGLMPRNHDVLHTWFMEISFRFLILEIKFIGEKPLRPSDLVDYYNDTYKEGCKFKIGVSI
jgi:hypothetical protein